jgi:GNAT superfamily N-acetyltransferase
MAGRAWNALWPQFPEPKVRETPILRNDQKVKYENAIKAKNIEDLTDYDSKMAWNEHNLQKLHQSPHWPKDPNAQRLALSMVYDRWIAPTLAQGNDRPMGMSIADYKHTWVEAALNPNMANPTYNFRSKFDDYYGLEGTPTQNGLNEVAVKGKEIVDFGHRMYMKHFTSAFNQSYPPGGVPWIKTKDSWSKGFDDYVNNKFDQASQFFERGVNLTGYNLGVHPSKSWIASVGGTAEKFGVQAGYYGALGQVVGGPLGVGMGITRAGIASAEGLPGIIGGAGKLTGTVWDAAANLTNMFRATKAGSVVAAGIRNYGEGYIAASIANRKGRERELEAENWAIQGMLFHIAGINLAENRERLLAGLTRWGGKALALTGFDNAISRIFNHEWDINIFPESYKGPGGPGSREFRMGGGPGDVDPGIEEKIAAKEAADAQRAMGVSPYANMTVAQMRNEMLGDPTTGREFRGDSQEYQNYLEDGHSDWRRNATWPQDDPIHNAGNYSRDWFWERSLFPVREHSEGGVTYKSRFIGGRGRWSNYILLNAYDASGRRIGLADLRMSNDIVNNALQGSWPSVHPSMQGQGYGTKMYSQVPSVARSYGFEAFHSEGSRTNAGNALWNAMRRNGFAGAYHDPYYVRAGHRTAGPMDDAALANEPNDTNGRPYPHHFESNFADLAKDVHGEPGTMPHVPPRVGIDNQFSWSPIHREDVTDPYMDINSPLYTVQMGQEMEIRGTAGRGAGLLFDYPHPDVPTQGYLVYRNRHGEFDHYAYTNIHEMQAHYSRLTADAQNRLRQFDPLRASLGDASEQMLYDLAGQHFNGRRDISRFTVGQQERLYRIFGRELQNAADNAVVHNPDVVKEEIQAEHNPESEYSRRAREELGVEPVQAATEHRVEQYKERGTSWRDRISDMWHVARNGFRGRGTRTAYDPTPDFAPGPSKLFSEEGEYEPSEGASASYGRVTPDIRRYMNRAGRSANLERIRTARTSSRRFLTNPDERNARLSSDRLAADGTRVGRRDPRGYHERLSHEHTEDFALTLHGTIGGAMLKDDEGNFIRGSAGLDFEKHEHRFLFHFGDRKNLPEAVVRKLAYEIRKVPGNENLTYAQMDRAADEVGKELIRLAKIGALQADGRIKIFKSSNFLGRPSIWQANLLTEVEQHEMQMLDFILKNYPDARNDMRVLMGALQHQRGRSYNIEDWIKYNRAIDDAMRGYVTQEMLQSAGVIGRTAAITDVDPTTTAPPARSRRSRRRRAPPEGQTVPAGE